MSPKAVRDAFILGLFDRPLGHGRKVGGLCGTGAGRHTTRRSAAWACHYGLFMLRSIRAGAWDRNLGCD